MGTSVTKSAPIPCGSKSDGWVTDPSRLSHEKPYRRNSGKAFLFCYNMGVEEKANEERKMLTIADVEEVSPRQNRFKRPTSHPKDSYREIRTWDVGLRYGAAIKQYKQTNKTHAGSHTGKRPHYRRGHFQHYWRGPRDGERTLEFIWIDPILVNADKVDGELPAVIHEVKDND